MHTEEQGKSEIRLPNLVFAYWGMDDSNGTACKREEEREREREIYKYRTRPIISKDKEAA